MACDGKVLRALADVETKCARALGSNDTEATTDVRVETVVLLDLIGWESMMFIYISNRLVRSAGFGSHLDDLDYNIDKIVPR